MRQDFFYVFSADFFCCGGECQGDRRFACRGAAPQGVKRLATHPGRCKFFLLGKKRKKKDRGDAAEHTDNFEERKFFFEEDDTQGESAEKTHLSDG